MGGRRALMGSATTFDGKTSYIDGTRLMGGGNTGQSFITMIRGVLSSSEIMSKGGRDLVNFY